MCIIVHTLFNETTDYTLSDKTFSSTAIWDRLGISISTVCAIHCLFFPVIISLLPLWSFAEFLHDWAHPVFLILLAPTVYYAAKKSLYDKKITGLLYGGILLVAAGWGLGHFWLGHTFETVLTVVGSFALIAGHWFNYKHHRTCKNVHHNHHPNIDNDSSDL